jgi:hypothetical protein
VWQLIRKQKSECNLTGTRGSKSRDSSVAKPERFLIFNANPYTYAKERQKQSRRRMQGARKLADWVEKTVKKCWLWLPNTKVIW